LQDVPVQVDVLTASTIQARQIRMTADIVSTVPNLSVERTDTYTNSVIVLRGLSQASGADAPVAVIVDGVPQNDPKQFNMHLFDIAQIEVVKGNFIGQILENVFDFLIAGVNGLLGMSVFIAIIGIVNTMTLSVLERRREIGLLRAVGMFPAEARRMVRYESVIIGVLGTIIGLLAGVLLAFLLINATDDVGDFSFEWPRLAIILVLGVLVGIVASWLPGRRVSRLNVLEALEP